MKYSWKKIKRGLHKATTVWSVSITEPPALLITYILANFFPFVTPTCVTLFNLFVVIPLLFWFAINLSWKNLLLYGIFFEVAHILDNVDGILARATKRTSRTGAVLDSLADRMANLSAVFLILGAYHLLREEIFLVLFFVVIYFRLMLIVLDRVVMKFYSEKRARKKTIKEAYKVYSILSYVLPFYGKYVKKKGRYIYFNLMEIRMVFFSLLPVIVYLFKESSWVYFFLLSFSFLIMDVKRILAFLRIF